MGDFDLEQERDGVISNEIVRRQRLELLGLLDQANTGWVYFMRRCGQYLGKAGAGRPSKADLAGSIVGACGFDSWRSMIEADRAAGGLGWKWSAYKSWQRAYNTITRVPGLRELGLEPSEINRTAAALRKAEILVETAQQWQEGSIKLDELRELDLQRKVTALEEVVTDLRAQLVTQSDRVTELQSQSLRIAQEAVEREKALSTYKERLATAQSQMRESESERVKLEAEVTRLRKLTWLDKLLGR